MKRGPETHVCAAALLWFSEVRGRPNDYNNHYPSDPFTCVGEIIHETLNEGFGTNFPYGDAGAAVVRLTSAFLFQGHPAEVKGRVLHVATST